MSSPKTHTPCTIRWRRLPSHANREGWLGIPYDKEGNRDTLTRYYVTPVEVGGLPLWTQHCDLLIDPRDSVEFSIEGEPLIDPEVCKMRCHLNWLTTLADAGA